MEFTKHLVLSLESTEIETWLASDSDPSIDGDMENALQQRSRRRISKGIIRIIYAKLIIQMIFTFIVVAVAAELNPLGYLFGDESLHVKVVTAYYYFSIVFLMHLVPYRHKFPFNYVFLALLTIGSSLTISTAVIKCPQHIQEKAVYSTIAWSLILSWYAFHTHIDYTVCGTILYYALCLSFIGGMVTLSLFSNTHLFLAIYSYYGILVFACFFIYDTQIMLGGTHFVRIDPSRHNFITINLYVNMNMMFYYHLNLFSFHSGGIINKKE